MENTEENKPQNPKAFPNDYNSEDGMDLRDYFAAKAMQGLVSNEIIAGNIAKYAKQNDLGGNNAIAIISYNIADAMLKQREL